MVNSSPSAPRLDALFHALGDPTRRGMLAALATGEQTVSELARPYAISLAAASKHVKVLESAGLLSREIRWRTHICRLNPAPLAEADAWLAQYRRYWSARLDTLETLLRNEGDVP